MTDVISVKSLVIMKGIASRSKRMLYSLEEKEKGRKTWREESSMLSLLL